MLATESMRGFSNQNFLSPKTLANSKLALLQLEIEVAQGNFL